MQIKRRPAPDITPAAFFETWLPGELLRLGSLGGLPRTTVRVQLEGGEGAGCWDLVSDGGTLAVSSTCSENEPQIALMMTVTDFRAIVVGEPGELDLCPPGTSAIDFLFLDAASQQMLRTLRGRFRFEVRGYNGRTWTLHAALGPEAGAATRVQTPDAVIAIDAATYASILGRALSPFEAYVKGLITLEGDQALGMQAGLAILPKF